MDTLYNVMCDEETDGHELMNGGGGEGAGAGGGATEDDEELLEHSNSTSLSNSGLNSSNGGKCGYFTGLRIFQIISVRSNL